MYNPHKLHVMYTAQDGAEVSVIVREPSPQVLFLLSQITDTSGHITASEFLLKARQCVASKGDN